MSASLGFAQFSRADEWAGASPDWTETTAADRLLMGEYEGRWLDAPKGHYHEINPEFVAQIQNIDAGKYRVAFMQEIARRANVYAEIDGSLDGENIRFEGSGWQAVAADGKLTGSAPRGDERIHFELKRIERKPPTLGMAPPPGAIVLFDGTSLDAWQRNDGRPASWHLLTDQKVMEVRPPRSREDREAGIGGDIRTLQEFESCRLHMEFRYPVEPGRAGQGRGNSGVFFQNIYEVQILNSYALDGKWNECGALYKHSPPMVNAALPPGQWQTYDITYTAPVVENGEIKQKARFTVLHNGILIHNDADMQHATAYPLAARTQIPALPAPIRLQDHGNAIQFRNIWLLPGDGK